MHEERTEPNEPRESDLHRLDDVWHLGGIPVKAGDLVEIRRARVGDEQIGDEWVPAVVGCDGSLVELEDPDDFVPGSRSGAIRGAGLRTLKLSAAEIRRA